MFLQSLRLFSLAKSLVEHSAIMPHASVDADAREALGITDGLVRMSVGIKVSDDLLGDLDQALSTIQTVPPPVYSMAARSWLTFLIRGSHCPGVHGRGPVFLGSSCR